MQVLSWKTLFPQSTSHAKTIRRENQRYLPENTADSIYHERANTSSYDAGPPPLSVILGEREGLGRWTYSVFRKAVRASNTGSFSCVCKGWPTVSIRATVAEGS